MRLIGLLLFAFFLAPAALLAQVDTVLLRDGSGNTIGIHTTIQAAYNAIPTPLTQAYELVLKSYSYRKSEHYPIHFTQKAGASAANTITIKLDPSIAFANIGGGIDTAEVFLFDGASWIVLNGEYPDWEFPYGIHTLTTINSTSARAGFPAIRFINGASHNTVRYCRISSGIPARYRNDEARILFDTTNTTAGNSFNVIEHCDFNTNNCIRLQGSAAHPNSGNVIRNNQFNEVYDTGVHIDRGTAATIISDNLFQPGPGKTHTTHISVRYLEDSTQIVRNTFRLNNTDSGLTGIRLAPDQTNTAGSTCIIANNYFSDGAAYRPAHNTIVGPEYTDSFARIILPIDIQANYQTNAVIAHNTVRIMPFTVLPVMRQLYSAVLRKSGNNAGASIQVLNNILHNYRKGGSAGSGHYVLDVADTSGISLDYNIYGSLDTFARIGSNACKSLSDYSHAMPASDVHSNDSSVLFESIDSHYLSMAMSTKSWAHGIPIAIVPDDKDANLRTKPYRGADELTSTCGTAPFSSAIFKYYPGDVCLGEKVYLQYAENSYFSPVLPARGFFHQWQSRPLAGNFADIPGANTAELVVPQIQYTIYRMKDSCVSNAQVYYSNWVAVAMNDSSVTLDSIVVKPLSTGIYQFTVYHAGLPIDYYWTFSDGQTTVSNTKDVRLAFYTPGTYTVTVYPDGWCGLPISKTFIVGGNSTLMASIQGTTTKVYPNPAMDRFSIEGGYGSLAVLTNSVGQRVMQFSVNSDKQVINVSSLSAGIYILELIDARGIGRTIRIMKQ